ncbi:MAG TPA: glycosyltransferase [Bacteroidia bacterium]|nr:glycosyltransferase [Bacteroidia bacterium]
MKNKGLNHKSLFLATFTNIILSTKYLHIVALDVPYPPDYGAAIDMYFRAKCLGEMGVKVIYHCFDYGRGRSKQLEEICHEVHYYPRKGALDSLFSSEPYIVHSRRNKLLFDRIFADEHPVFLEGTHTCACLTDDRARSKKIFVRMHNIEEDYYRHLAEAAPVGFTKWYYSMEAKRLKRFEPLLSRATGIFSVSEKDHKDLSARFSNVEYLPPFIYNDKVECLTGRGEYALYHGNLMVEENLKAAEFLLEEVFNNSEIEFIVAGKGANDLSKKYSAKNFKFIDSPTGDELTKLIQNAHVNVLPTFQPTGIKHKLVNALFTGRYCVVNPIMVEGIGLDKLCITAKDALEMRNAITELFKKDFPVEEIVKRKEVLEKIYSNKKNAEKIVRVIFGE